MGGVTISCQKIRTIIPSHTPTHRNKKHYVVNPASISQAFHTSSRLVKRGLGLRPAGDLRTCRPCHDRRSQQHHHCRRQTAGVGYGNTPAESPVCDACEIKIDTILLTLHDSWNSLKFTSRALIANNGRSCDLWPRPSDTIVMVTHLMTL